MISNEFNEYVNEYKKLSLKEKEDIIIEQLKLLAGLTNTMCKEMNIDNEILLNNELLDIANPNYTDDDYSEALLVLVTSIQNSLCDFSEKLTEIMEYINDNK